ncbi:MULTISPECIES: hypothetical protein [Archaeoglobus]|uniref:Serine/threonine protein kinase n=3 Tax=Archaeoglobus fulgidus TaxID=2234 RepID=O29829_ARCFU|nr:MULTISPECIES: hypothetical protein [Archaeoglobus]AAB90815.1 conserved hypothetical protein [Archaeoglobus fulgidus DSM 4304]AIG97236.1 putative Ser/Thr protein kinase [Archaeoglobus fulgidus DSM 8774]KUJ94392.1 MAG: hypothetical protein XD40_0486 [Archaeoglobus fulgidus]KUK06549.1 MAG: hypothetical protein XD48_1229 [Archaeoglobus fulgidus]MDI3497259.1 putative serine/threonine protein kinase [Archaeoglobus sp.]
MPRELGESLELRKGRHSVVYLTEKYAIKQFHERFRYNFLKEVKFLTLLQPFFFTPKLYFVDFANLRIVMERLRGRRFDEAFIRKAVERALEACFIMDVMGVEKQEMNHPDKHIIVGDDVYLIDFERARFKDRPSNLTQFCMYLRRFGIEIEKTLLKDYKTSVNCENFSRILHSVVEKLK